MITQQFTPMAWAHRSRFAGFLKLSKRPRKKSSHSAEIDGWGTKNGSACTRKVISGTMIVLPVFSSTGSRVEVVLYVEAYQAEGLLVKNQTSVSRMGAKHGFSAVHQSSSYRLFVNLAYRASHLAELMVMVNRFWQRGATCELFHHT